MEKRRVFSILWILAGTLLIGLGPAPGWSQDFPSKPITIYCGFEAGATTDLTSRALAEEGQKILGVPVVVENKPGGGSTVAASLLASKKPDGYTLGIAAVASLTVVPHRTKLPYGPPDDYLPIIKLVNIPICLSVKSDAPWKTLEEFVAAAKASPGKIRVGLAGGLGTLFHLNLEQFKALAKVDLTAVPFAGGAESVPALLGGHVNADVHTVHEILPHVQAGKARVLGVFEEKRNSLFPGAPTFREKGFDVTMAAYYLVFGPKGLPSQVVSTVHDSLKKAMEEPAFQKPMKESGFEISYEGPADIKKRLMRDYEQCRVLVETLNLKEK